MTASRPRRGRPEWTFLSNHGHVLVVIAQGLASDTPVRLRAVAQQVGITERSVYGIVADLEKAGFLERSRVGRENRYRIHWDAPLRHPNEADHTVGELLELLAGELPHHEPS